MRIIQRLSIVALRVQEEVFNIQLLQDESEYLQFGHPCSLRCFLVQMRSASNHTMAMYEAAILFTLQLSQIKQSKNLPDLYEQHVAACFLYCHCRISEQEWRFVCFWCLKYASFLPNTKLLSQVPCDSGTNLTTSFSKTEQNGTKTVSGRGVRQWAKEGVRESFWWWFGSTRVHTSPSFFVVSSSHSYIHKSISTTDRCGVSTRYSLLCVQNEFWCFKEEWSLNELHQRKDY